jgi:hypothetical protein
MKSLPVVYHPEKAFLPADTWDTKVHDDVPVTIIDNFYRDPEAVRSLAQKLAYTNHPDFTSYAPVLRSVFYGCMASVRFKFKQELPDLEGEFGKIHTFNVQAKGMVLSHSRYRCPHLDSNSSVYEKEWSLLVYLSSDTVGTSFFKPPNSTTACQTIISTPEYLEGWEESLTVQGKFNRALVFPSSECFHKVDVVAAEGEGDFIRLFQISTIGGLN